jgi:hypothetical protein
MAEVIDLDTRKKQDQERKDAQDRSKKMEAVVQMFQCSRCAMKCMKCGSQVEISPASAHDHSIPYRLCQTCREEYREFLDQLHGRGDPSYYWFNREWVEVWKAWMHYQDSLTRYQMSEGFRKVVDEIQKR